MTETITTTATKSTTKNHQNEKSKIEHVSSSKRQDSLLTTLIDDNPQIRSLHNMIMAFVAVFVATTVGDYLSNTDRYKHDFAILRWNVRDFYPHFLLPWTAMHCIVLGGLYPLVCLRSFLNLKNVLEDEKEKMRKRPLSQWTSTALNLAYFLLIPTGLVSLCTWYLLHHTNFGMSISFALTMEMTRLLMKSHSYFMETGNKEVQPLSTEELRVSKVKGQWRVMRMRMPSIQSLLYYLFAPTLIYQDSYPRTERIRWRFVLMHLAQFLLAIFVSFVAINRFLVDNFRRTGLEPFEMATFSRHLAGVFTFGVILAMICFYALLHLWHNITAEVLRFADRSRYYGPWWESVSLNDYYRKWNLLVQDWLYAYVYLPVYRRSANRQLAVYSVILVSGIAHEYIIGFSIRFFFPLLFVIFSICGHIYFLATRNMKKSNLQNTIFMLSVLLGWGLISMVYSVEWYSRVNCPKTQNSTLITELVPRLISCVQVR